ncbi:MAG TPA: orotate phosphoribosyltransferase, partial [Dongiaceae bacterium]
RIRGQLVDFACATLARDVGFEQFDVVAGGETAGIPYAAWIAERLGLPMQYIRKKPKGFGRGAQIEGDMKAGARCLLVEDLATDGGSKVNFVNAIRDGEGQIAHAFVVFHYGIFPQSLETLGKLGVKLHGLATWWDMLEAAKVTGLLSGPDATEVRAFLENPEGWSSAHGGKVAAQA